MHVLLLSPVTCYFGYGSFVFSLGICDYVRMMSERLCFHFSEKNLQALDWRIMLLSVTVIAESFIISSK